MERAAEQKLNKSATKLALEASAILSVVHSIEGSLRLCEIEQEAAAYVTDSKTAAAFQLGTISTHVDDILQHLPPEKAGSKAEDINRILGSVIAFIRCDANAEEEKAVREIARHYLPKSELTAVFALASQHPAAKAALLALTST